MSTPEAAATFNRRNLLRSTAIGVLSVGPVFTLEVGSFYATEALTGMRGGNAGLVSEREKRCGKDENCLKRSGPGFGLVKGGIVAPLQEEIAFRVVPSFAADMASGFGYDASAEAAIFGAGATEQEVAIFGTGHGGLDRRARRTRRSFIVGALAGILTTAEFAALHNFTPDKKFRTDFLPTPQAVAGGISWALQRKFGAGASIAGHMAHNSAIWFIQTVKSWF